MGKQLIRSRAELETIIRRSADQSDWEVFSEDPRVIRKMQAIHGPGKAKGVGWVWVVPTQCISFRKSVRGLASDDQKAKRMASLAAARAAVAAKKAGGGS